MNRQILTPTHVVADALNLVSFHKDEFDSNARAQLELLFAISPEDLDDLANEWTKVRPDLLIGAIDHDGSQLKVVAGATGLDPCSSTIIRHAVEVLSLKKCWRALVVDAFSQDTWVTPLQEMHGGVPPILFHGTTDNYLPSIALSGLTITGTPNWEKGGRDAVFLTASPQIAAFHARRTSDRCGGQPIIVACNRPPHLHADWDVVNQLVKSRHVPSNDSLALAREAGLFASRQPVRLSDIVEVRSPALNKPYSDWARLNLR